jgi:CheY-like chemotaxis protein
VRDVTSNGIMLVAPSNMDGDRVDGDKKSTQWQIGVWLPPLLIALIGIGIMLVAGEHIKELPPLIWVLLACYAVWLLREPLVALAGRIEKVKAFGVELKLAESALGEAITLRNPSLTGPKRKAIMELLRKEQRRLNGAEILWVDDKPSGNRNESRALQFSGAAITFAATTDEAIEALSGTTAYVPFDLIISDMKRGDDPQAGLKFIEQLRNSRHAQPLVFYVGKATQPPPDGSIGITDRPDDLIKIVLSALRGRDPASRE